MGTPENTKSKLDATPGQSADDWQQQVDTMQRKKCIYERSSCKSLGYGRG